MKKDHYIRESFEKIKFPKVLVIGDLMLDQYSWGEVDRISPEAPIPVMKVIREEKRLGGAGNAAMNLKNLGAKVIVCGVIGSDENGNFIRKLLSTNGIDISGVIISEDFKTCLKHRMIAGQNHLLRMDIEPEQDRDNFQKNIMLYLKKAIPKCDAVLVSDYGKGLLNNSTLELISDLGKRCSIPILGDPRRGADYKIYKNFTLVKPNRKETEEAVGFKLSNQEDILKAAKILMKQARLKYIIISLDKDGLLLFSSPKKYKFFGTESQEVFDVVGAGDAVISILSYMLAANSKIEHAVFWAQIAASMVIKHIGVISFSKKDLLKRFDHGDTSTKIMNSEQVCSSLSEKLPVVFTNGYFDEISSGHLKFLHSLKTLKGFNIVAINSDKSILKQKGTPPLLNELERAILVAAIESVDRVIIFNEKDASELIRKIRPETIVKGEHFRHKNLPEKKAIDEIGAKIKFFKTF